MVECIPAGLEAPRRLARLRIGCAAQVAAIPDSTRAAVLVLFGTAFVQALQQTIAVSAIEPVVSNCPNRRRRARPLAVLVADDNEDLRRLWNVCLSQSGFSVTEAVDGVDALEKVADGTPDVIVMDFSMPRLDGGQAVLTIKGNPSTASIPIIGLTAFTECSITREFWRLCDLVLQKPLCPDALLDGLRLVLRPARHA
jgi:CheY-like chemotaxis protein